MKRFPVTSFNIHRVGSLSPSEQLDRPEFRLNLSHWGPVGLYLKSNLIQAVLKLLKTRRFRFEPV